MKFNCACLTLTILLLHVFSASAKDYTASFFGIRSGGTVLNTRAIQFGIDYISGNGGGRLVFPAGRYLTGCIHLKSDVTLHLEKDAVLLGSTNPFDYDRQNTPFDHNFQTSLALILGLKQRNIGITGQGEIDGQGKELAEAVGELVEKGLIKDRSASRPDEDKRPMIINLFGCDQVTVKNISLRNSACWVECYNQCKNVTIDSIRVESRAFWNNDGIDIVDCSNFKVTNSYFNSSDDGICLKSLDPGATNQNILIQNNRMTRDKNPLKSMPGVVIGGLPDQIISKIKLKNIIIKLPGGADKVSAKISIDNLKDIPEKPSSYPEYDMFGQLPSWGIFIRHAGDVHFDGLTLMAGEPDFRTAIVMDDVHNTSFKKLIVKEPKSKKKIFSANSTGVKY